MPCCWTWVLVIRCRSVRVPSKCFTGWAISPDTDVYLQLKMDWISLRSQISYCSILAVSLFAAVPLTSPGHIKGYLIEYGIIYCWWFSWVCLFVAGQRDPAGRKDERTHRAHVIFSTRSLLMSKGLIQMLQPTLHTSLITRFPSPLARPHQQAERVSIIA